MYSNDEYFMKEAIKEAKKAYKKNEIPVGAVLVYDNKIISRGHNLRFSTNIVTKHAEIIAIEKANKINNNWRLTNYVLYTTLEPCSMCKNIIKESKISHIIYGAKNNSSIKSKNYYQIKSSDIINTCESIIKSKFKEIRKK